MAEFTEVWNEWKRMCKHEQLSASCRTCPLYDLECNSEHPKDQNHYDGHAIEEIIMGWAEEYREPVYPTWGEWLYEHGVVGVKHSLRYEEDLTIEHYLTPKINDSIPADLAEKLGLEPKGES